MAYIKAEIADYGTEDTLLQKIRDLFINNTVAQFSLVEENFTKRPYSITVGYNNLRISVTGSSSSGVLLQYKIYIVTNDEATLKATTNVLYLPGSISATTTATRTAKILIAKNENDVVVNIAPYTSAMGKGAVTIVDIITVDDNEIIGYSINSTVSLTYLNVENQTTYTARPYHTAQKSETELWLDPELTFYNSSSSEYFSSTTGITGLGGGVKSSTYTTTAGDKYYCCDTNIAIKLNEEVAYEVE